MTSGLLERTFLVLFNRLWARLRGKPDPYTRIGQRDHFELLEDLIFALDDVSFTATGRSTWHHRKERCW